MRGEEYGEEERAYLTRKTMDMSEAMWQVTSVCLVSCKPLINPLPTIGNSRNHVLKYNA